MRAISLPAVPIRPACDIRAPADSGSSNQIRVTVRATVLQKAPAFLRNIDAIQIEACNKHLFPGMRRAPDDFTERIRHERATPEAEITFAAHAIYCGHENSVQ